MNQNKTIDDKEADLEIVNSLLKDLTLVQKKNKKRERYSAYRKQINSSIKSLHEEIINKSKAIPNQQTPCTSKISNTNTPLELDETEIAQIETENIKQELQKTVACIQDTLEKPEIKEGFFEKCFNKFLEYVKVKEEDLSEFYETVIENKSLITHNNLLEKFEREEASGTDEEEIQINNMAYNRGPSFKDIIQLVPNFSGRDRDEAIKFVKGCKHAEELLDDNQQKDFLKFIRVKLSGVAHECIDTTEMENIKALTDFVESNFGSDKLFFECYGDLAKLKQENNETVLSFYARLKDVEREIEAVARRDSKYNQSFKANLQTDLLAAFKRGLRWEIKARLTANTLDEARNEAIKIEREDGFDGDRNKFKSYNKNMTLCTICESKEHSTIDCDTLKSLGKFNNYSIPFNIKTVYQERKGMNHISKGTIDSQQNTDARKTVNQRINNICGVQACNNNIENLKFSDNPKRSEKETATQSISNKMSTAHKRVESKEALSQSATENELLYEENNFCTQYTVRNVDRDILDKQRDNNEHFGTKGIVHSEKALSNEQIDDYDENFDKMDAVCSDNRV
ncbi:hypothetical protein TKK_0007824 [Trichogramma kaykai]